VHIGNSPDPTVGNSEKAAAAAGRRGSVVSKPPVISDTLVNVAGVKQFLTASQLQDMARVYVMCLK
jgi:hypothetical protein